VVVTYRVNWEVLKGLAPPRPPEPAPEATVGRWLLASPTPKTVGQGYFSIIETSAGMVRHVVDYLATLPEVDPTRIAIAGTSTTGFTTLEAVAVEPRLAAAVVIAACGDYHRFLHLSSLGMDGAPLDLDPAYDAALRRREPIRHPERLVHVPLLMVNGTDDLAIPVSCARESARVFRAAYARAGVPDRFRWVLVERAGHNDLGERAIMESRSWLQHWLALEPGLLAEPATARAPRGRGGRRRRGTGRAPGRAAPR
jgi:pimeloyl-ACP methyl ester carboxylesterase